MSVLLVLRDTNCPIYLSTRRPFHSASDLSPLGFPNCPTTLYLQPLGTGGSGEVRDPDNLRLVENIEKVNELFEGDLEDENKVNYVDKVLRGKLLESEWWQKQASSNTREQFAGSPDLFSETQSAIMGAMKEHQDLASQALASKLIQAKLIEILLSHSSLYEDLRARRQAV